MHIRDLFFINHEGENTTPKTPIDSKEEVKFPSESTTNTTISTPKLAPDYDPAFQPYLEKIITMYEKGFDSLNMDGYDFFEFYKSVIAAGVDKPEVYAMAIGMSKAIDSSITKDKLVTQSEFYISEIQKVHTQYVSTGTTKKQDLVSKKENEKQQLTSELQTLKMQLEAITNQIQTKEKSLSEIDNKYFNDFVEIDSKLMANDVAKDKILSSITKVKEGLINNIK